MMLGQVDAQVTIGSGETPNQGALLDLKQFEPTSATNNSNATKGLLLPRVNLEATNQLPPEDANFTDDGIHTGLLVCNLKEDPTKMLCKGVHIWDGNTWINLSNSSCGGCEYTIVGHDGTTYYLPCDEYQGTQSQAIGICETKPDNVGKTYHLITESEYTQIWNRPTKETGNRIFTDGNTYHLSYLGWITAAKISTGTSSILGVGFPFSGGVPIGGELTGTKAVRCVRK